MAVRPIFALLTDFGTRDGYVGSLKAAILKIQPEANIIDISHDIPPQDIGQAAFLLRMSVLDYPPGTIFICVVDPGVGSSRHAIVLEAGGFAFFGPDNGLFNYIYDLFPNHVIHKLENRRHFSPMVSSTFHGRDIFAPCAAAWSTGVDTGELGSLLDGHPVKLDSHRVVSSNDCIQGTLVYADVFGNLVSNVHVSMVPHQLAIQSIKVDGKPVRFCKTYSEAKGRLMALWGSSGFLEISWPGGSALLQGGLEIQMRVELHIPANATG